MEVDKEEYLNLSELTDLLGRMGYYFDKPDDKDRDLISKMFDNIQFFNKYDHRVKFEDIA